MSSPPDDPPRPPAPCASDLRGDTPAASAAGIADIDQLIGTVARLQRDRFGPDRELASGGMGRVDRIHDQSLLRRLAMKVIHAPLRRDAGVVGRFIREAQITGQLDHPNIVPVHEIGVDSAGHLYFTMKLVEGRTLAELIDQLPPGPIAHPTLVELVDILVKVCDALALAHSRGVVHRDVKPENIMVGDFGQVYLMDWGVAGLLPGGAARTTVAELSDEALMVGTPSYMAPEQARCQFDRIGPGIDIFGVGATLYEIIARRPPYRGDNAVAEVEAAQRCDYPPLVTADDLPVVPRPLIRIAERALAEEISDRYPSVVALKKALHYFVSGGGEFPMVRLPAGNHVVREGEPGDTAYIIAGGRCEVYKTVDGRRLTLRTMGPGAVFGETAILAPGPRTASVVALDDVILHVVSKEILEAEVGALKPWVGALIRALAHRLREREAAAVAGVPLAARPSLIAEQLLMRMLTWGRPGDGGGIEAYWSHLRTTLAERFGQSGGEVDAVVAEFREIVIDEDLDRVRIDDPEALKRAIRAQLHRDSGD